jgi:hypothetical protein
VIPGNRSWPTRLAIPLLAIGGIALSPTAARADVVWPALYLEDRLFTVWAVALGLAIEAWFLWRMLKVGSVPQAAGISVLMNTASAILGILLLPLAGLAWELFPGSALTLLFDFGTFNPITWVATAMLAVLVNFGVEGVVLSKGFEVVMDRRAFTWLAAANAITVAVAMMSLWRWPIVE